MKSRSAFKIGCETVRWYGTGWKSEPHRCACRGGVGWPGLDGKEWIALLSLGIDVSWAVASSNLVSLLDLKIPGCIGVVQCRFDFTWAKTAMKLESKDCILPNAYRRCHSPINLFYPNRWFCRCFDVRFTRADLIVRPLVSS